MAKWKIKMDASGGVYSDSKTKKIPFSHLTKLHATLYGIYGLAWFYITKNYVCLGMVHMKNRWRKLQGTFVIHIAQCAQSQHEHRPFASSFLSRLLLHRFLITFQFFSRQINIRRCETFARLFFVCLFIVLLLFLFRRSFRFRLMAAFICNEFFFRDGS